MVRNVVFSLSHSRQGERDELLAIHDSIDFIYVRWEGEINACNVLLITGVYRLHVNSQFRFFLCTITSICSE